MLGKFNPSISHLVSILKLKQEEETIGTEQKEMEIEREQGLRDIEINRTTSGRDKEHGDILKSLTAVVISS